MLSNVDSRTLYLGENPSSDVPVSSWIFISFIVNVTIFYFLPSSITPLIKSYILSTIHACACIIAVCIYYMRTSVDFTQIHRVLGGGIKNGIDETMAYSICYSSGYFIYDTIVMLLFKSVRSSSALLHHTIGITGMISGLYTRAGHSCQFLLLVEELSTIPLNLKFIFSHRTQLHAILSYMFAVTFILCRMFYGTIVSYYMFRALPEFVRMASEFNDTMNIVNILVQAFMFLLTRALNLYWTVLILRKLCYKSVHTKKGMKKED